MEDLSKIEISDYVLQNFDEDETVSIEKISKNIIDRTLMEDEKYYRKYVRSNFRRNLAKHDELLFSHKNLYRIHLHLTSDRM